MKALKIFGLLTLVSFGLAVAADADSTELLFVGSGHTNIIAFRLDTSNGTLDSLGMLAPVKDASFIAITPNRKFLYVISEGNALDDSIVSAFAIDKKNGKLTFLNQQLTGGTGPCYVAVDPNGRDVLVANYISGNASIFPIGRHGELGDMSQLIQDHGSSVNHSRQEGPHVHCVATDWDDRFVFFCDLGLDKVMIFQFDRDRGLLTANDPPAGLVTAGDGPRHIAFHPNRRNAYVVSELTSAVTTFAYDRRGGILTRLDEQPLLPAEFKGQSYAAEIAVHPSGKFVYASNRGYDSIVVFRCDPNTGRLTFVERDSSGGKTPRNFDIDPSGKYLLVGNEDSNNIVVFSIDPKTGHLEPTGSTGNADNPMCVKFLPR